MAEPLELKITAKKGTGFYIRAAATFLLGTNDKEAVNEIKITGLGNAVEKAVSVASYIEKQGLAMIMNISTEYPEMNDGSSCCHITIHMKRGKMMKQLSPFFDNSNARALLIVDAKIDDALFLWSFFLQNYRRPKEHRVHITVFVLGIKDRAGGVALVKHLYKCAQEVMADSKDIITLEIFASKTVAPWPPRHETDTYRPYNDDTPGFPKAAAELTDMKFFQDGDAKKYAADFVAVTCQYFLFEVYNPSTNDPPNTAILDYLVPKAGGMLAFQAGFNTAMKGELQSQLELWNSLTAKVSEAGAKISFISNAFSFAKDGKPGTLFVTNTFFEKIKAQSQMIWTHLIEAGLMESFRFGTDQMAKWLSFKAMDGVNYDEKGLRGSIEELKTKYISGCSDTSLSGISSFLASLFLSYKKDHADFLKSNPVLHLARELYTVVDAAVGNDLSDYLHRAVISFENYGQKIEVTDGQHMVCLLQSKVPILWPAALTPAGTRINVGFCEGKDDQVLWAARNVGVQISQAWMTQSLEQSLL